MGVEVGTVRTFANVEPDKAQAIKPLEEAAEVFGAWQEWDRYCKTHAFGGGKPVRDLKTTMKKTILDEIADCIQALCNLAASLGVEDMGFNMKACERRNEERGRYEFKPVLAADGKPIKPGQTVYVIGVDEPIVVSGFSSDGRVLMDFHNEDSLGYRPEKLTHERPDSWDRIENDVKTLVFNAAQDAFHGLHKSADKEMSDGAREIMRRCKTLAEKEASR